MREETKIARFDRASLRILPPESGIGPLDIVIAIMAFLATLALGAALIAGHTADSWRAGLTGKLTVQILPDDSDLSRTHLMEETGKAVALMRATGGIAFARPLSESEERELVKPWIGDGDSLKDLPLPQLIDADLTPGAEIDIPALRQKLKAVAPHASLDDHSYWMGRLQRMASTVICSAWGILILIAVALIAVVSFATEARLRAQKDMVTLLHQMGAQAGYIARTFERPYFRASLIAGATGMALAGISLFAIGALEMNGAGAIPFLPPLSLPVSDYLWLIFIPLISGLIGKFTARCYVWRTLSRTY